MMAVPQNTAALFGEIALCLKESVAKPDELHSMSGTHVAGENQLHKHTMTWQAFI